MPIVCSRATDQDDDLSTSGDHHFFFALYVKLRFMNKISEIM